MRPHRSAPSAYSALERRRRRLRPRVTPRQWGGWGYRWRPDKGTAVIVRRGEGVVLRLGDGHTFTITVDNAEAMVRIIRDRLRPATRGAVI